MFTLSKMDEELVFDHCIGLVSPSQAGQAERLIDRSDRAAELRDTIQAALAPLAATVADCPDELVDHTVERLRTLSSQIDSTEAPAPRVVRLGLRRDLSHVAAVVTVAASILLIVGAAIPAFDFMRHRHYRQVCLNQLAGIFRSIDLYSSDHDNTLPAVARVAGAPWHGIGGRDPEGYSNTANLYLLLKHGYSANPRDFICCGSAKAKATSLESSQLAAHHDFPSREHITYSYRLMSNPRTPKTSLASRPLMADMNPHFEKLPLDLNVRPAQESLTLNSRNHGGKGQNILWGDGRVLFSRTRIVGDPADDIYTIKNISTYRGVEWPASPNDTFVAP